MVNEEWQGSDLNSKSQGELDSEPSIYHSTGQEVLSFLLKDQDDQRLKNDDLAESLWY